MNQTDEIEALKNQLKNNCKQLEYTIQCNICGYTSDFQFIPYQIRPESLPEEPVTSTPDYLHKLKTIQNYSCPLCNTIPETRETKAIMNSKSSNDEIHIASIDKPFSEYENIKDNSINTIIALNILNQIDKYKELTKEFYRILNTNGELILKIKLDEKLKITFENDNINTESLRKSFYGNYKFNKVLGHDFIEYLTSLGFEVIKTTIQELTKSNLKLNAINPKEIYYKCIKKE